MRANPSPAASFWSAGEARRALSAAPTAALGDLAPSGTLLVVAPHPDDESLGCGGVVALAADAGRPVVVAILTSGDGSHPGSRSTPPALLAALREGEAREAVAILAPHGAEVAFLRAPDGRLSEHADDAQAWLDALFARHRFAAAFAPWEADPHPDHKAAASLAEAAAAAHGSALFAYPVWGLTLDDAAPAGRQLEAVRLDIAGAAERKARAIAAHRSQTTGLIDDDPQGFRLTAADLSRHAGPTEAYFRVR